MAAHLVVPTVFRLVVGGLSHFGELFLHAANHLAKAAEAGVGGNSVHHGVAQLAADQVAEHLYVVTSRAVAAGHRGIEVVALAPLVLQGGLGQQLQVVGGELTLVCGIGLHGVLVGNAHRAHLHRKAEVGRVGGREVLHLQLFVVQAQPQGERQAGGEQVVEGGLVEQGAAQGGGLEASAHAQLLVVHRQLHGGHLGVLGSQPLEDAVGIALDHLVDALAVEGHRAVGVEVLVEAEGTGGPLPALAGVGLEHHLFAQRVDALPLLQVVDGCSGEVLVDEHAVAQPLVARHGAQREAAGLVLQVEASVEQVASVAARLVVADGAYCGLQRLGLLLRIDAAHIIIGIATLVVVLVAQAEVELPAVGGEQDAAEAPAYALCIVHLLAAEGGVAEESALVVVVASGGEGEAGAHAVVVGERGVVVVARGSAQAQVGALVAEGRLGVDLDESAHGVASIEGALRAAQHIDALNVGIAKVEGRLVDVGDVVHVEAYRGGVDARANAADIDGRGEA